MVASALRRSLSLEEYFELEAYANMKHEYVSGTMIVMAGGAPEHGVYAMNVAALLIAGLQGRPCRVQSSDVRIRIDAADLNTYPDLSVVSGPVVLDTRDRHAVTNPCLLVDVLSPTTEAYDRGPKLAAYQQLASVQEVLFVGHDVRRLELLQRRADGTWSVTIAGPGETLTLAVGCPIAVDAVYFDRTAAIPS